MKISWGEIMLHKVNGQKYVRTGDKVVAVKDNMERTVHYVVNKEDQLSFDEPWFKVKKLICYCGNKIEHLLPVELIIN